MFVSDPRCWPNIDANAGRRNLNISFIHETRDNIVSDTNPNGDMTHWEQDRHQRRVWLRESLAIPKDKKCVPKYRERTHKSNLPTEPHLPDRETIVSANTVQPFGNCSECCGHLSCLSVKNLQTHPVLATKRPPVIFGVLRGLHGRKSERVARKE